VKVDPSQVEQVIVNLAVNARDAMPHGGALLLSTENTVVDEEAARRNPGVEPGRYVSLHVEDTGVGMDAGTMAQIFEPFFTTKEVGRGTGLGLATVYGIVKQSGGAIWVDSEKGRGTRFRILLPRVELPVAGEPASDGPGSDAAGSETVLLVEDEPSVRVLSRETLREHGYQVLEAGDGEEALRVAQAHDGPIHLLLTDVIMPRLRGRALADQLRRSRPAIRLLYISGYPDTSLLHQGVLEAGTPFLEKPFTPDTLVRRVRQALDGGLTKV
jgi:CheY-like chemotaxis protein